MKTIRTLWKRSMQRRYGPLEERKLELMSEDEWEALPSPLLKLAAAMCEIAPVDALIEGRDDLRALIEAGTVMRPMESMGEMEQLLALHELAIRKRAQ